MLEPDDLLTALRDVGVTIPTAGDAGAEHVRTVLEREITGRRPVTPRRRTLLRCGAVAATVAVAAVVVVAIDAGDGSNTSAPQSSAHTVAQARETAFIVRRVRDHLARLAIAGEGQVLERTETIGNGTPERPVVRNTNWAYIDPRSGVAYQRSIDRSANGTVLSINRLTTTPIDGVLHTQVTFLNPFLHTYLTRSDAPPGGTVRAARSSTQLGIRSTAQLIEQALRHSTVTMQGTATVDGQATIKLSVPPSPQLIAAGVPRQTTFTLYVNAQTYQPVQEVRLIPRDDDPSDGNNISTTRWLPTTAASIALARVRIPASYQHATGPVTDYWTLKKPLFFLGY